MAKLCAVLCVCREMALPIGAHLKIPAKNIFCNTMSWQMNDKGEPVRLQVSFLLKTLNCLVCV